MGDYCDGELFRSIDLFQNYPNALQLITYFDEVEVCNPLGAQRGVHKLGTLMPCKTAVLHTMTLSFVVGLFYYTLGNIRPELRSTQRSIQLIACVTSPILVKYGFQSILKPFIDDVNTLCRVGLSLYTY